MKKVLILMLSFAIMMFSGCCTNDVKTSETTIRITESDVYTTVNDVKNDESDIVIHYIDVGQGDSTFIELPDGSTMLIDAGEIDQGGNVATYIFSQGYDTIDYVVATHAHSDHIGGLTEVIESFKVNKFYMTEASATTSVYENMLSAVEKSNALVHTVMAGDTILNSGNLSVEVVAPKAYDEEEQNNNSIVIKITYGDNKFLFTGDAEKEEEDGIWTNIKCDVLKIGHHGSNSSTTSNFLKKVEPKYAVISCGLGNSYGHPTDEVLTRLEKNNIEVYRTDLQGTIVASSDGKTINFNVVPAAKTVEEKSQTTEVLTYVLNISSKKIHLSDCSSVKEMNENNKKITDNYDKAISEGYTPCGKCKP